MLRNSSNSLTDLVTEVQSQGSIEDLTYEDRNICIDVVIPTLNEEMSIGETLDQISSALNGYEYMTLVVDGNSSDNTAKIAREKGAMVILQRNKGYGDALLTGFDYAYERLDASVIVMMDADMTYDPKDIPRLLEPILENRADMVVGNRFKGLQKGSMPFLNTFGNRLLSWIARQALDVGVYDTQCGIRAFKSVCVEKMSLASGGMPFATEMLAKAKFKGARIEEVPVVYRRRIGKSKLNPMKDGMKILGTILRLAWERLSIKWFEN